METLATSQRPVVLTRKQARILRVLIACAMRREDITYKDLAVRLGMDVHDMSLRKIFAQPLDQINQWCRNRNVPLLASLVVRGDWGRTPYQPGPGFWKLVQEWGYYFPIGNKDSLQEIDNRTKWIEKYHERVFEFWGIGLVPYNA